MAAATGSGIVIVALLAAALVSSPASAGPPAPPKSLGHSHGLEYVRAKAKNVTSQDGAAVPCDNGDFATGGGGAITGKPKKVGLNTTAPTGNDAAGWRAEGHAPTPETVSTYAICGAGEVAYAHDSITRSPGEVYQSGGSCPNPSAVSTGGGIAGDGGDARLWRAGPFETDIFVWNNGMANAGVSDSFIDIYWACTTAYDVKYREATERVKAGKAGTAIAHCKKREAVAGGGLESTIDASPVANSFAVSTRPWDSKRDHNKSPEDGWLAKAQNGNAKRVNLTAVAACVS